MSDEVKLNYVWISLFPPWTRAETNLYHSVMLPPLFYKLLRAFSDLFCGGSRQTAQVEKTPVPNLRSGIRHCQVTL